MRIILTGTPGVGKSKLALLFAARLRYNRLDLNATIVKDKLYSGYDRQRRSYITDMRRVIGYLRKTTAKGDWIIDSHLAHLLPKGLVDVVLVLRCAPIELEATQDEALARSKDKREHRGRADRADSLGGAAKTRQGL